MCRPWRVGPLDLCCTSVNSKHVQQGVVRVRIWSFEWQHKELGEAVWLEEQRNLVRGYLPYAEDPWVHNFTATSNLKPSSFGNPSTTLIRSPEKESWELKRLGNRRDLVFPFIQRILCMHVLFPSFHSIRDAHTLIIYTTSRYTY